MSSLVSINPTTGQPLRRFRVSTAREIDAALDRAVAAQAAWRELSIAERSMRLRALGRTLRRHADDLARLATAEMGKPLAQALAEVEKCAAGCDYYAKYAGRLLRSTRPPGAPARARVVPVPMGVVLAFMPWNFPYWQVIRAAAPALAAGNVLLLKHAAGVPGCALALVEMFREAGLPEGAFQALLLPTTGGSDLIDDPRVAAVALTGSTGAGRIVGARAGAALKKGVFELGGSDPYLVLEDADLDHAAAMCATARLLNNGQSCIAGKRFIVVERARAAFEEKLVARMAAARMGDPLDAATDLGPLARADLRDTLHRQVQASVRHGARLLLGGKVPRGAGFFYPATVLTNVAPGMPASDEELFGPVAAIIPVRDEEAAIAEANRSAYGLGAAVFTRDRERGLRIVRDRLECGVGFVNDFVRSDPTLPFGGTKASGHGRELGLEGIREFTHAKTVWASP